MDLLPRQVLEMTNHHTIRRFIQRLGLRYLTAFTLTLISASPALAAGSTTIEPASCNFLPSAFCGGTIDQLVTGIGNWLMGLIIAISLIMIVVSGAQMASASDSPDRLKAAKGRLTAAITSLVFLVLFRAILAWLGIAV